VAETAAEAALLRVQTALQELLILAAVVGAQDMSLRLLAPEIAQQAAPA
jgi:hypothetical protein